LILGTEQDSLQQRIKSLYKRNLPVTLTSLTVSADMRFLHSDWFPCNDIPFVECQYTIRVVCCMSLC